MRILFLTRSLNYGGAERQLAALARSLAQAGHEPSVAVFYAGGPLEEGLRQAGVPIHDLRKRGRWDLVRFSARLLRLARRLRPEVIHGYQGVPNIFASAVGMLVPSTTVVWGVRASEKDLSRHDLPTRVLDRLHAAAAPWAHLIIANSESGKNALVKRAGAGVRVVVVQNGIDTDRFRFSEEGRRRVREEWGVGPEERLVGIVARLNPVKDHATFLRAAASAASRRIGLRFAGVGAGAASYASQLRALARELGLGDRTIWAGARDDVVDVYSAFDLFTLCSRSEGFPNVIGEAMACGRPCVVTDVGDSATIVGDVGLVVEPAKPQALADGWLRALELGEGRPAGLHEARRRVEAMFSVGALRDKTVDAIAGATEWKRNAR